MLCLNGRHHSEISFVEMDSSKFSATKCCVFARLTWLSLWFVARSHFLNCCFIVNKIPRGMISIYKNLDISQIQQKLSFIGPLVSSHCPHDDVIKWKRFSRYWPFVRGIHRSPVNSQHKGQWLGALMFSLICVWINGWVNNREAGDLRRHHAHYDVIVMPREMWLWFQMRNSQASLGKWYL